MRAICWSFPSPSRRCTRGRSISKQSRQTSLWTQTQTAACKLGLLCVKCKSSKSFGVVQQLASCHDPGTVLFWHVLLMMVAMSVQGQGWWCHSRALGFFCKAWTPTTGMACACQVCDRPIPSFPIHLSLHSLPPSASFVLSHLPPASLSQS